MLDNLLTRIGSFFNISKTLAITPAGIIASLALALLLWPPRPHDVIMDVDEASLKKFSEVSNSINEELTRSTNLDALAKVLIQNVRGPSRKESNLDKVNRSLATTSPLKCSIGPRALIVAPRLSASQIKDTAIRNQEILDLAYLNLQSCIKYDSILLGAEDASISNIQSEIQVKTVERDALQKQYVGYATVLNPLQGSLQAHYQSVQRDIAEAQQQIVALQQEKRARQANIDLENQYIKSISDRLADPGRLRPQQNFDDLLAGIGNHIVGFLLLSLLIGYALDPLNTALFGAAFDALFVKPYNRLRRSRFTVDRSKRVPNLTQHRADSALPDFDCSNFTPAKSPYLLFPTYALGQQIISQNDLDSLNSRYFAQSQLAFGLIFPTILLAWVISIGGMPRPGLEIYLFLAFVCFCALWTGVDRLHKYYSELQLLIKTKYCNAKAAKDAQAEADKTKASTATTAAAAYKALTDQVKELATLVQSEVRSPMNVSIQSPTNVTIDCEASSVPKPKGDAAKATTILPTDEPPAQSTGSKS